MTKSRIAIGLLSVSLVLAASIYGGKVSAGCGWLYSSPGDPGCTDPQPHSPCTPAADGTIEYYCPGVGYNSEYDMCYCAPY